MVAAYPRVACSPVKAWLYVGFPQPRAASRCLCFSLFFKLMMDNKTFYVMEIILIFSM